MTLQHVQRGLGQLRSGVPPSGSRQSKVRTCTMLLPVLIDDMMEISRARLLNHSVSPDAGRCSRDKTLPSPICQDEQRQSWPWRQVRLQRSK